jgi:hypothetical protein
MLKFTDHPPRMDRLLNTEYEKYSPNRSGAGELHFHTYIHTYIRAEYQKPLFHIQGA